jgi:hypothetical protein
MDRSLFDNGLDGYVDTFDHRPQNERGAKMGATIVGIDLAKNRCDIFRPLAHASALIGPSRSLRHDRLFVTLRIEALDEYVSITYRCQNVEISLFTTNSQARQIDEGNTFRTITTMHMWREIFG